MSEVAALLDAARRARCRDAEVYVKKVRVRQVAAEPPAPDGALPQRVVSRHAEGGTALRVIDAEGREGFAWRGAGEEAGRSPVVGGAPPVPAEAGGDADDLLREALESARIGGRAGAVWPAAPEPGPPVEGLVDPGAFHRSDDALAALAAAAVAEVTASAEGALEIDRVVVTEAASAVRLARLSGGGAAYERTTAAITVAVAPAVPEADAAVEERSACRLDDLDPIAAARAAVARALPRRPASLPEAIGIAPSPSGAQRAVIAVPASLILAPRAAASLWAAFAPLIEAGAVASPRPSALDVVADGRAPGRPSSAPCDGAGRPGERRRLMQSGRVVGRVEAASGPHLRVSYRDLPSPGVAALVIEPGRGGWRATGVEAIPRAGVPGDFALRVEALEVHPGPTTWSIEIRRGDWCRLEQGPEPLQSTGAAATLGAADGIFWEGPPAAIVQAVVATLDDLTWFEVGLPVATPSVVLDGLGPWRLPDPAD